MKAGKPARPPLWWSALGSSLIAAGLIVDRPLLTVAGIAVNAVFLVRMWRSA